MTASTLSSKSSVIAAPNRLGGLDGLRAIAVGLVVIYHLFPEALPGGFLGVDVFFVISGFLISTLLISEHRQTGRIALGKFWRRRARRLLPALALVLLISTSAALLAGKDLLVNIAAQLAGASFFVANWVYIALGTDYFAQENPELFRNTWSLAIEEQFYVFLPLLLIFSFRMRSAATRVLLFTLLGLSSAAWMSALFEQGAPATRVYFGTDTHVFGLLLGVALALALRPPALIRPASEYSTDTVLDLPNQQLAIWQQIGLITVVAAGLGVLGWFAATLREGSPESFMGGFQIATLATLAVVWAATRTGAWVGRALDFQPLRWIGERSYGIYLWHWPVLLITSEFAEQYENVSWWVVPGITVLLTLALASASHRYIEQPVRRIGLFAAFSHLFRPVRLQGRSRAIGLLTLLVLIVTLPATGVAVAVAPAPVDGSEVIARGQATLDAMGGHGGVRRPAEFTPDTEGASANSLETDALGPAGFGSDWADAPHFEPPKAPPIEGWEIFALGDSVMLASAPELAAAFPEIWIDAAVSRGLGAGVTIAEELAERGELRPVLVVGLGTNGPIDVEDLEELVRIADGRGIVLVNAYADRWWVPEVNQLLQSFAEDNRGVTLADWAAVIPLVPGGLAGDDIHPNPIGGEAYVASVQLALDALRERNEQPLPVNGKKPTTHR